MEWLIKEFEKLNIKGRDDFYTGLLMQEWPIWLNLVKNNRKINMVEVEFIASRRGFNPNEVKQLTRIRNFLNNNMGRIQSDLLQQAGFKKQGSKYIDPTNFKKYFYKSALNRLKMKLHLIIQF